ncbi:MAG: winged helix-turn-helix domain-containing protein [Eubacteriales bacterium]|nr:winged helix-turn-helix domain-containing protein [Eubacteriales bacterium]
MPKRYHISKEQIAELEAARKSNKDKNVEKRIKALLLRAIGKKLAQIAESTEYHPAYVSQLVSIYCNKGLSAIIDNHHSGNRRNMSLKEEATFLLEYKKLAEQGQIVEVGAIKKAYEEKVAHTIGKGQIYRVLKRQGWRKVMPRSKHPNKASEEACDASKKLTIR